jgi:hypothetical protein
MKFVLEIDLSPEDGLHTMEEVAQALQCAAERIRIWYQPEEQPEVGNVGALWNHTDRRPGRTLGHWVVTRGVYAEAPGR